jgi:hypothetical protein
MRPGRAWASGGGGVPVDLVEAQAAAVVAVSPFTASIGISARRRPVDEVVAARAEVAARRAFVRQREVAGDGAQRARVLVGARQRDRAEQRLRVGVAHLVEDVVDVAGLHRLAGIHHGDAVADLHHQAQVVADEQHRGAVFRAQLLDQIDDPGLDRHIERGGGFVEDQERGLRHQRHGDDDALLLAARQLVRIGCRGCGRGRAGAHRPPAGAPAPAPRPSACPGG